MPESGDCRSQPVMFCARRSLTVRYPYTTAHDCISFPACARSEDFLVDLPYAIPATLLLPGHHASRDFHSIAALSPISGAKSRVLGELAP